MAASKAFKRWAGHHQAVEAERDAGAVRQANGERGEQPLVQRAERLPTPAPRRLVLLEAAALFRRVAELTEAVCELEPVHVELESLGDLRAVGLFAQARERRLRGRVIVNEDRRVVTERRPDDGAHQQVEPLVALPAACLHRLDAAGRERGADFRNSRSRTVDPAALRASLSR